MWCLFNIEAYRRARQYNWHSTRVTWFQSTALPIPRSIENFAHGNCMRNKLVSWGRTRPCLWFFTASTHTHKKNINRTFLPRWHRKQTQPAENEPKLRWCNFHCQRIYFHIPIHFFKKKKKTTRQWVNGNNVCCGMCLATTRIALSTNFLSFRFIEFQIF